MVSEKAGSSGVVADIGTFVRAALLKNGDIEEDRVEQVVDYLLGGQKVTPDGLLNLLEPRNQDADANT